MRQERRRHPRLAIPLEAELRESVDDDWHSVTMQDLSAGGAGLLTTRELATGTEIASFRFELPADEGGEPQPIELPAQVARSERQEGVAGEAEYQLGIQFTEISHEQFDQIQQFVFKRLRSEQKDRMQIERPIAIRFDRFDDFVEEVSLNLSASGMFIRTRDPRAPGAVFNFQFQLGEDFSLIEGRAEVVWRRRQSEGPDKPAGMGVRFVNLDVPSQKLIDRLVAQRQEAAPEGEPDRPEGPEELTAVASTDAQEMWAPPEPAADFEEPGAVADRQRQPPEIERAEVAVVSLMEVEQTERRARELAAELEQARVAHQRELEELRAGLEERHAAAAGELEEQLRKAESAREQSELQRGEVTSELEQARAEVDELRRSLAERPDPEILEHLTAERDELRSSQKERQIAFTELEAARDGLQAELERLRGDAEEIRRELADRPTTDELERTTAERDDLRRDRDEIASARADAETALGELRTACDGLQTELERFRGETDELHRQLADRPTGEELEGIQAELERVRGEAEELTRQLAERPTRAELEQLASEREELEGQLETERRTGADLKGELESARAEIDRQLKASDATLSRLRTDHEEALERARGAVREEADAELAELRDELAGVREARDRLEEQSEQERLRLEQRLETEGGAAAARIEELEAELTAARERADRLDEELRRESERLGGEAESARREIESLRQEMGEARAAAATEIEEVRAATAAELEEVRGKAAAELEEARTAAASELEGARAEALGESERLQDEIAAAERARSDLESRLQAVQDEAGLAASEAEERQSALRAELETAKLAAAGKLPPPKPRRGRRAAAGFGLLAAGTLIGALAAPFVEPLGSLGQRLGLAGPGAETARSSAVVADLGPSDGGPSAVDPEPAGRPPEVTPDPTADAEPTATQPAAGPEPAAPPSPDPATAEKAVRDWAAAWSEQRVDDYLASYAASFQPADGESRDVWAAERRQRIERPRSIAVSIVAPQSVELEAGRVSVSFDQGYTSDTYSDQVRKTLVLVWEDEAWKIAEERSEG